MTESTQVWIVEGSTLTVETTNRAAHTSGSIRSSSAVMTAAYVFAAPFEGAML